jgi:hypothetical protein
MSHTLVATLTGNGSVFDGDTCLADVRYSIRVYQFVKANALSWGLSRVPTLTHLYLDISSPSKPIPMSLEQYTLHLNDGRKLNFSMYSPTTATPIGGIY